VYPLAVAARMQLLVDAQAQRVPAVVDLPFGQNRPIRRRVASFYDRRRIVLISSSLKPVTSDT
jgi:hypothetical protein